MGSLGSLAVPQGSRTPTAILLALLLSLSAIPLLLLTSPTLVKNFISASLSSTSSESRAACLLRAANALSFLQHIEAHERKVYSQQGEDGVLEYIFDNIGSTDRYYVEFGTQDGRECNTRHLWERYNFSGVLIDLDQKNSFDSRIILNRRITEENIVGIFEEASVPLLEPFDLLSIDIDGNDYHVAKAIFSAGYRPRVFIAEMNRNFGPKDAFAITYNEFHRWQGNSFYGTSMRAWHILMDIFNYRLVYQDKIGVNLFFIYGPVLVEYLMQPRFGLACVPTITELTEVALPPFESLYHRQDHLHVFNFPDFFIQLLDSNWSVVLPSGDTRIASTADKQQVQFA